MAVAKERKVKARAVKEFSDVCDLCVGVQPNKRLSEEPAPEARSHFCGSLMCEDSSPCTELTDDNNRDTSTDRALKHRVLKVLIDRALEICVQTVCDA